MANRVLSAQLRPVSCKVDVRRDMEVTKPGLAVTPTQIKELTDRGIAVNLPNANQFLEGNSSGSWEVDPVFKRNADMCELWEIEQTAKNKIIKAHKVDKKRFGTLIKE
jgi:hypothetical protein